MTRADAMIERFIGWFGNQNLFIELQRHFVHGDLERNRALATLAQRTTSESSLLAAPPTTNAPAAACTTC